MATSVMLKQRTGSWSAIFPTEQVTQQQSALFVKKLLAVAISNITYLRTIFPEHAFGDRCLEDLSLKILRDDSACPGACQVIQWVKGCFDALDRKFLRMIIVGIYMDADDPMTAVETYSFKFDYKDQKGITIFRNDTEVTSAFSETETKKATIKLLRTIIVLTQTLEPLPDDVMMTMKLFYYEDVTPEDYEPPGFQATSIQDFEFAESAVNIRVGDVNTPFHTVKLRIKTNSSQFTPSNAQGYQLLQQLQGEGKVGVAPRGEVGVARKEKVEEMETAADTGQATGTANRKPLSGTRVWMVVEENKKILKENIAPHENKTHSSGDNIVHCPCGVNEDDGLMVLCAVCQEWQHAVCFGFLEEDFVPDHHVCIMCSQEPGCGRQCSDPSLSTLTPQQLQSVCLWRRTLHACRDLTRLVTPGLARRLGVGLSVAQGIMDRMEREGYIRPPPKGKKWGRVVVRGKLMEEGIPKYFEPIARKYPQPKSQDKHPKSQDVKSQDMHPKSQDKHPKSQDMHPKSQDKSQDKSRDGVKMPLSCVGNVGVDQLTQDTSGLNISVADSTKAHRPHALSRHVGKEDVEVRRSPRIRAKRVRSVLDESKEFELSSSQEDQCGGGSSGRGRKRRKASIASNSIMV